ncbi:MAG: 50S ribosomal protein L24 [Puniceicoccales bacterium]|jgi:large subunit ribosomal protein L24|nr:50S ribosomal protein L24 [Puniceicoccales bacterium]
MKQKIHVGDRVKIISGNHRGEEGEVLRVFRGEVPRLTVMDINKRKKGLRKSQQHPDGLMVLREMPIHMSNVRKVEEKKR